MISVYQLKPAFQNLLQPALRILHKFGVTANQLTVAAILLSIGLGLMFLKYQTHAIILLLLPLGLLLRMALNALDGMMARQFQMQSKLGEVLNEVGDVLSDLAIILPLVIIPGVKLWVIVLFGLQAVVNEFAGLLGRALGGARRYEGPMGKSDRALLIGLYCIVYYCWPKMVDFTNWIFIGANLLMVLSTFTRLKKSIQ
jgi:CDP-diacylglycerol---glycerol-3-phosphate 3-phosphatidyltransferase